MRNETKSYVKSIISILTVSFFAVAYTMTAILLITGDSLNKGSFSFFSADQADWGTYTLILYASWLLSIIALLFGGMYLSQVRPSQQKQGVVIGLMILLILAHVGYIVVHRVSQG